MKVEKTLLLHLDKPDRDALERVHRRLRAMNYSETLRRLIRLADEQVTVELPTRAKEPPCSVVTE